MILNHVKNPSIILHINFSTDKLDQLSISFEMTEKVDNLSFQKYKLTVSAF